ncbi:MAG: transglutaminase-like domain-containing protein, partial [Thermodesulfobacteriota bacterium]
RRELIIEISGIASSELKLDGGRQKISGNRLSITKEDLGNLPLIMPELKDSAREFGPYLASTLFIQSDHNTIKELSKKIAADESNPLMKVRKIAEWINTNIEKKPVLSVPDALSTLTHRMGDCNEHAILFAALSRASGIPTMVETGLVFLNGRFYYHAWNRVYVGRWITVDSLFNQIPADVSHIRLTTGADGSPVDLLGVMGRIRIKVVGEG